MYYDTEPLRHDASRLCAKFFFLEYSRANLFCSLVPWYSKCTMTQNRCDIMRQVCARFYFPISTLPSKGLNWQCDRALTFEYFFPGRLCPWWRIRSGHGWWYADAGVYLCVCVIIYIHMHLHASSYIHTCICIPHDSHLIYTCIL